MNGKRNLIAHKQVGTSDKVYMACVRRDPATKEWVVIGKYGRRTGNTLQIAPKMRTAHESVAYAEQRALFNGKLKTGYKDVEENGYNGPVSRSTTIIKTNLETEKSVLEDIDNIRIPVPDKAREAREASAKAVEAAKVKALEPEEDTVVCADNSGIEEQFDVGIEYVCERHTDRTMIWVYDKFGKKTEYFRDRFKSVAAAKTGGPVWKKFAEGEEINVRTFKEKAEFAVVLAATPVGRYKIPVIKEVRDITGLGLRDSKNMVEGAPKIVKEGMTNGQAAELKIRLESVGAKVEVVGG